MTDGIMEGFTTPSEAKTQRDPAPAIAQLIGRLLVVRGTHLETFKEDVQKLQPDGSKITVKEEIDKQIADVTFLTGDAIGVVLDKVGQVTKQLDPPMRPGETRSMILGGWFKSACKDRMGNPGWPGLCGVLTFGKPYPRAKNDMWYLTDPSPEQSAQAAKWLAWKRQHDAQNAQRNPLEQATAPAPVAPPVVSQSITPDPWAVEPSAPAGSSDKPAWM